MPHFIPELIKEGNKYYNIIVIFVAKVNDVIKRLKKDGWYLHRHGSRHDIYRHPLKKGVVVMPRHQGKELAKGTLQSILKAAEL